MGIQICGNSESLSRGGRRQWYRLLILFIIGLALSAGPAFAGRSICGGENQQPCGTKSATKIGRPPNIFECPAGSFFDIGTESCWSCPQGYNRSAESITGERACSKAAHTQTKNKATKVAKADCPEGTFWDPIHGGTCWSCPEGFHRTAGHIEAANACAKATGVLKEELHTAIKNRGECPKGTFFDFIDGGTCWTCPEGFDRTASRVDAWDACIRTEYFARATEVAANQCSGLKTAETGAFWDPIEGGTCWTCPKDYPRRTMAPVHSTAACAADRIVWQPNSYNSPGVFGIGGMDALLAKLVREHPELIVNSAKELAGLADLNPVKRAKDTLEEVEKAPEKNLEIRVLAAAKIMDILQSRDRSREEEVVVYNFAKHYSKLRRHFADEMKGYFDAYQAACTRQKASSGLSTLYNYGCKAQEPSDLIMHLMGADLQANQGKLPGEAVGLSVVNGLATRWFIHSISITGNESVVVKTVFPNMIRGARRFAEKAFQGATEKVVAQAVKSAVEGATKFGTSTIAGGAMIFSAGVEIAIIAGQQAAEIAEQQAKVNQAYRDTRSDMSVQDLTRWVNTETGYNDVQQYLGLILAGGRTKGPLVQQAAAQYNHPKNADTGIQQNKETPTTPGKVTIVCNTDNLPNQKTQTQTITGHQAIARDMTSSSQLPQLATRRDGPFRIALSAGNNLCLAAKGNGNPGQGNTLELAECTSPNVLPFSVLGNAYLATKNNLCMDTKKHGAYNNAPLELWGCAASIPTQKWQLTQKGRIRSKAKSYLCVKAQGPLKPGTPLAVDVCANNPQQIWKPAQ